MSVLKFRPPQTLLIGVALFRNVYVTKLFIGLYLFSETMVCQVFLYHFQKEYILYTPVSINAEQRTYLLVNTCRIKNVKIETLYKRLTWGKLMDYTILR